jgi:hypothetical protein
MIPGTIMDSFHKRRLIEDRCACVLNILWCVFVSIILVCASAFAVKFCHYALYGNPGGH